MAKEQLLVLGPDLEPRGQPGEAFVAVSAAPIGNAPSGAPVRVLAAMGVAYWARLRGRHALLWFAASVALTPLGGSVALMITDRYDR